MMSQLSNNVASAMLKLVAGDAIAAFNAKLIMGHLVSHDFEPHIHAPGEVVDILSGQGAVTTKSTLKQIEATFQIPDITKVLLIPELLQLYMGPAIQALAAHVESTLADCCLQFAAPPMPPPAAAKYLSEAYLPEVHQYAVLNPSVYIRAKRRGHEFANAREAGDPFCLVDGPLLDLNGLHAFRSDNAPNAAFLKRALNLTLRRPALLTDGAMGEYGESGYLSLMATSKYNPLTLAQTYTLTLLYGCEVLRPDLGVPLIID
jgi:hypothetical protein